MSTEQHLNRAGTDLRSAVASMPLPGLRKHDNRSRAALAFAGGLIAVMAMAIPLYLTQLRGPSESPLVSPTPSSTTTMGNTSTIVVDSTSTSIDNAITTSVPDTTVSYTTPEFLVTDLGTAGPDPDSLLRLGSTVDEVIQGTGKTFDTPPGYFADATVLNGRVIAVGGNETYSAEIWYSDGGEWMPAVIRFSGGTPTFGEDEGGYRLADGVTNLEVVGETLVAWEPIQYMTSAGNGEERGEPVSAGTIVLHGADGASWVATIVEPTFSTLVPWKDGAIATSWSMGEDGQFNANALWSEDFAQWAEVADLGEGRAYLTEVNDQGMTISLSVPETTVNEDGSITYGPGLATRQVVLAPNG
jgi:hypothetical protein